MTFRYYPGPKFETIHHYDSNNNDLIASNGSTIHAQIDDIPHKIHLPLPRWAKILSKIRLGRRFARLDKINVILNHNRDGLVIVYQKGIYFYSLSKRILNLANETKYARNPLHGGIAITPSGIYFGEYWANEKRHPVPIWSSKDDGRTWNIVHELTASKIRHVHGIYNDDVFEGEAKKNRRRRRL